MEAGCIIDDALTSETWKHCALLGN